MTEIRDLLILGTGVHAAEMAEIAARINAARPTWRLLGFIAAERVPDAGAQLNGLPILGSHEAVARFADAAVVPDLNWPHALPEDRLISLVDPSCFVSRTAVLGAGCVLYPNCFVGLNARLGGRVFCLSGAVINHDDVIGDGVIMASHAALAGYVQVESGCYLGQSSSCRQSLRIGANSLIGMGAVVVKDVPANSVMVGNPARKLRDRN